MDHFDGNYASAEKVIFGFLMLNVHSIIKNWSCHISMPTPLAKRHQKLAFLGPDCTFGPICDRPPTV